MFNKGATVTVVRGVKVPRGTTGVVIWVGGGQYGERLGIRDAAGAIHWTAAKNVEVDAPAAAPAPTLPFTTPDPVAPAAVRGRDLIARIDALAARIDALEARLALEAGDRKVAA